MPKEQVLNDPLAAEEIKAIVIARIEDAFSRNQALIDDVTYAGFRVSFEIKFQFFNSLTAGTLVWGEHQQGEKSAFENPPVTAIQVAAEYQSDPSPNRTREDNALPLPVMVNTSTGPQKRRVRIQNAKVQKK